MACITAKYALRISLMIQNGPINQTVNSRNLIKIICTYYGTSIIRILIKLQAYRRNNPHPNYDHSLAEKRAGLKFRHKK